MNGNGCVTLLPRPPPRPATARPRSPVTRARSGCWCAMPCSAGSNSPPSGGTTSLARLTPTRAGTPTPGPGRLSRTSASMTTSAPARTRAAPGCSSSTPSVSTGPCARSSTTRPVITTGASAPASTCRRPTRQAPPSCRSPGPASCSAADLAPRAPGGSRRPRCQAGLEQAGLAQAGLAVGHEADARVTANAAALAGAEGIVAGDPQADAGERHVVRAEAAGPGRVPHDGAAGRREPAHAWHADRAWPCGVTVERVVEPPLVAAEIGRVRVGGGGEQRVAAGVVDPLVADRGLAGGEGGRRVAQPGAPSGPGRPAERVEAGGPDVDGAVIRRPGRGLDVKRLTVDAGPVELLRRPAGHRRAAGAEAEHEDLLPGLAADRGEDALDQVEAPAVAQLLVEAPGRLAGGVVP